MADIELNDRYLIIVAGGSGTRMNSAIPKQFIPIAGKPLLMRTIERFVEWDKNVKIILVIPKNNYDYWNLLCREYHFSIHCKIVYGGKERFFSVKKALDYVPNKCLVGIHDGVRPFVSNATITDVYTKAKKYGAAVPVVKPVESMRVVNDDNSNKSVNRNNYRIIQTPQCFISDKIKESYNTNFRPEFTDDASVYEFVTKSKIVLSDGNIENIKITTPIDIAIAEAIFDMYKN